MLRGGIGAHTPDSPSRASLRGEPCPKFCQERIEFLDSADDVLRLAAAERFEGRGAPGHTDRGNAGGVGRHHVVGRIADVDGLCRLGAQLAEGEPDRIGVGFVLGGAVGADDDREERGETDVRDGAIGKVIALAGAICRVRRMSLSRAAVTVIGDRCG